MQRRKFGRFDTEVSLLGFGCMRFPTVEVDDPSKRDVGDIDEERAIEMLHYAIDNGVDYVDTAYPYHGGASEVLVGKALKNGYREKVKLATKLPTWKVTEHADFEKIFQEQLDKLQTDHVDVYLVHALNQDSWQKVKDHDVFSFLKKIKADGRAKYVGFSFHDNLDLFKEIVDSYTWDVCQIQLNYMDENYQAGVEGLNYAADRDLAVIIMEPLRGGKLAKNIPNEVAELWGSYSERRSPAEWAFRWVANHPAVTTILSGMGAMDEVKENIRIMEKAAPNSLGDDELALIDKVKSFYKQRIKVDCTDCKYCMPCPNGVVIPGIFGLYNDASIYGTVKESKGHYQHLGSQDKDASQCIECGQCEAACPQNLAIINLLKDAHQALA